MSQADEFLKVTELVVLECIEPVSSEFSIRYGNLLSTFLELGAASGHQLIDGYRRMLSSPRAAREKLLFMAAEEACGASILRHFAQWAEGRLQTDLEQHAADEDRHAKMLSRAAHNFCPDSTRFRGLSVDPANELIGAEWSDFPRCLWNIHLNEIVAYSNYFAMRELAGAQTTVAASRLVHTLDSLMKDELRHIAYSTRYLESWIDLGKLHWDDLSEGMADYDQNIAEAIARLERILMTPNDYPFDPRLVLTTH